MYTSSNNFSIRLGMLPFCWACRKVVLVLCQLFPLLFLFFFFHHFLFCLALMVLCLAHGLHTHAHPSPTWQSWHFEGLLHGRWLRKPPWERERERERHPCTGALPRLNLIWYLWGTEGRSGNQMRCSLGRGPSHAWHTLLAPRGKNRTSSPSLFLCYEFSFLWLSLSVSLHFS